MVLAVFSRLVLIGLPPWECGLSLRGRLDPLVAAAGMRLDEPGRKEV